MALPAGMGLSAAAAAAGYSYQSPNPTPEPVDPALTAQVTASEDPEEMLLGGLAALSEPEPSYPSPGNSLLGSPEEIRGSRGPQGAVVGVVDPAQIQMRQQEPQQQIQQPQQLQLPQEQPRQQQQQEEEEEHQQPPPQQQRHSMMQPLPPPRIHQVTSPPPPHPPASMLNVIDELRSGGGAVLPGGGVGLQAMLRAKRELRTLRATVALSEEVKKRFPFQAAQSVRLTAAEEKLDKKISAVRRRLYCKLENVEWASKSLRVWLSLEVISDAKSGASGGNASGLQQQQQQQQDILSDRGKGVPTQRAGPGSAEGAGESQRSSKAGWCVLARVQGTVIDVPADGVERRFTSFFSKVVLRLDSKAFPGVATVEWVRSKGCEELHCVELKLPLERALALGMKAVNVKVFLHPRLDDGRPRRFTLSPGLRRALCLSDRVETKPVLVAAACEALRHRGLISSPSIGGAARGGAGGVGIPMIACDPALENIIGTPAFPFSQLEEALGPHVEPAAPPMLEATIALEEGSMREARLDVRVDTEAPFQLQAAKCLLGDAAGQPPAAVAQEDAQAAAASAGMGRQNGAAVGLGVVTVQEQEARAQLDRQISYLVEAVNSSGRRAAMLRALSEDPMEVVPRLEAQMLVDEEMLGATAGAERPARLGEFEPWLDVDVCGKVIETRQEERKKDQVRRALEAQRKERAAQHARADAALQQAAREQRKRQREARAAAQAVAAAKQAAQREREQQQQQQRQRLRLREAQERAVLEGKELKRRQHQQHQEKQHQRMKQAVMLAQQAQEQQARAARAAKVAARQEQRAAQDTVATAAATGRGTPVSAAMVAAAAAGIQSDALGRMRAMQQRQNQTPAQAPHRVGPQGQQHHIGQQQQQQLRHSLPPQGAVSSPRVEGVTPPISTSDPIAGAREHAQQTQQLQGLAAAAAALTASNIAFQGHHKKQQQQQQALPLPSLGSGLGSALEDRFQQHQQRHSHHEQTHEQEDAAITMDAEERKRQELLEQTLLSPNDDLDPPTPQPQPRPAPSPSRQQTGQQQQQQYQWPTSGAVSLFPNNPDVTERCFQQTTPTGRGGGIRQQQQQQQQHQQQQHVEPPPRVGSAGSPQVSEGDSRQQQMEETWLRRRHLEHQNQQRQRQGIAPISHLDHGGGGGQAAQGFQSQLLERQLTLEDQQQNSSSFDGSAPTASPADMALSGAVQDTFRGGLVVDRQRKEQRTEDQRRYRQRQYQQLAQLAHIQQQQQRQRQGLVQAGQGGGGIASAVPGLFRPAQRGEETVLQQAEWTRRAASTRGQPLGGALENQGGAAFDPQGGRSQAGTPTESDAAGDVMGGAGGGGGIEEQQQQQHPQQQQQNSVSSYSGWQSQAERRRSDSTLKK